MVEDTETKYLIGLSNLFSRLADTRPGQVLTQKDKAWLRALVGFVGIQPTHDALMNAASKPRIRTITAIIKYAWRILDNEGRIPHKSGRFIKPYVRRIIDRPDVSPHSKERTAGTNKKQMSTKKSELKDLITRQKYDMAVYKRQSRRGKPGKARKGWKYGIGYTIERTYTPPRLMAKSTFPISLRHEHAQAKRAQKTKIYDEEDR